MSDIYGRPFKIPQLNADPLNPAAETAWVRRTGSGGSGGGKLTGMYGITVPNSGGSYSYQLRYRTKDGVTKGVNLT